MAKTEDVKIKTRATKDAPPKQDIVQYTFAESLAEATEWYGEDLCKILINKAVRVGAQAAGRPLLSANKSHEEIQSVVSSYRPEATSRRGRVKYIKDMDTLKEEFANMPDNEKAAMLAMFEAYLRGDAVAVTVGNGEEEENGEDEGEDDDDDEDAEPPPSATESPPRQGMINRAQRKRGPQYD